MMLLKLELLAVRSTITGYSVYDSHIKNWNDYGNYCFPTTFF